MTGHEEFPLREGLIYLNHAAVAPWPRRTAQAVRRFAEENVREGSLRYPDWLATEEALRRQLQRLLNATSSTEIALVKNTSEGLSLVAYGLDWRSGDNIVSTDREFPSNRVVWESLASRGVTLRQAPLDHYDTPEQALMAQVDEHTRLLAVSSVQYGTGLALDLEQLGAFCRSREILFCVDAIQSLGARRLDVAAIHADFVAADGHKWMLGPEGLGVFYCRADRIEQLNLTQYGWHMVEHVGEFDRTEWEPAHSARRFECGSPNMLGIHALHASLSLLEELGMPQVEARVLANSAYLLDALGDLPDIQILTPTDPKRYAGIVSFRHPEIPAEVLFSGLQARGIWCAQRGGGVRFSPHFHTPQRHLEQAIEAINLAIA